jgi:hypothetical protein
MKAARLVILGVAVAVVGGCWDSEEHKQEHRNVHAKVDEISLYLKNDVDRVLRMMDKCLWVDGLPVTNGIAKCGPPQPGINPPPDTLPAPTYP